LCKEEREREKKGFLVVLKGEPRLYCCNLLLCGDTIATRPNRIGLCDWATKVLGQAFSRKQLLVHWQEAQLQEVDQ
jgi:hypothetical protein